MIERDGDSVVEVHPDRDIRVLRGRYRELFVSLDDGQVTTGGTDTETVTVEVVDGVQLARGDDPDRLDIDATLTCRVDGVEQSIEMTGGKATLDITTSKPAGATISVEAVGLNGVLCSNDAADIEVIA